MVPGYPGGNRPGEGLRPFSRLFGMGLKFVERKDTYKFNTKPRDFYHPPFFKVVFFFDQVEGTVPYYNPIELHLGKIDVKAGKWQGMGKEGTKLGSQIQHHTTRFLSY